MSLERILTITNRTADPTAKFGFGDKLSSQPSYLISFGEVTEKNLDMPEWLRFLALLRTPIFEMCWKRHAPKVRSVNPLRKDRFFLELDQMCKEMNSDEVVISLHGFNLDCENDKQRGLAHAKARQLYGGKAMPEITLDWAASSGVNYFLDSTTARISRAFVVDAIAEIASRYKVHIVGFSMGNQILTDILAYLKLRSLETNTKLKIESINFVSGDVAAMDYIQNGTSLATSLAKRVSVYISGHDQPLQTSELLNGYPRLGQLPGLRFSWLDKLISKITGKPEPKLDVKLVPELPNVHWYVTTALNDTFGHNEPFGVLAIVDEDTENTTLAEHFSFQPLRDGESPVTEVTPNSKK